MKWRPFVHQGEVYDLSHVHPFEWTFSAPATQKRPKRDYSIRVVFSMHTFTQSLTNSTLVDESLHYWDSRETRQFCFKRYALSKKLKEIVKTLGERRCYHTHHGSFFTIEFINENGDKEEYEVYFKLSRSSQKGRLNLYVQSAYMRDETYQSAQPKKRKIGFQVIAYNTLLNKRIKPGK